MKQKIIFVLVFICLLGALKLIEVNKDDNKALEKVLNETYVDYANNPTKYIITKAEIIEEYDSDMGSEINFYESKEWLVQYELYNGTVVKGEVCRGEEEKIGDIIDVAYLDDEVKNMEKYPQVTQLCYVECVGLNKSNILLEKTVKLVILGMIVGAVIVFVKKRIK